MPGESSKNNNHTQYADFEEKVWEHIADDSTVANGESLPESDATPQSENVSLLVQTSPEKNTASKTAAVFAVFE
jgi:hypothetical protein